MYVAEFKMAIVNTPKIQLPVKQMNQPYVTLRAHVSTARGVQNYAECNYTEIIHACYFSIFRVSPIQIGCCIHLAYAECMNMIIMH